jgi:hypothetical protein
LDGFSVAWLRDWKRKRILARHRIDDALWRRAQRHLPFLHGLSAGEQRRLKELAVVFLAEKQLTPVRGLELSEDDRVEIALQACLPILELGLDWYDGWVGIVCIRRISACSARKPARTAWCTSGTTSWRANPGRAARWCCPGKRSMIQAASPQAAPTW